MGCGGSTVYSEDGGVAAGKGETKIEWNPEKPVEVGFYYYTENDAKILVKEFPMDKECVEKQFTEENVVSSSGGMHWVKCVPGTRYAFKYTEGGHSVAFPGQKALEIPKKIHAFHTKDDDAKKKLAEDLKKEADKDEGNAYKEEGSEDKINADIDGIGSLQSCAEMPKEMVVFKKACVTTEDLQPFNTLAPALDIATEYGHWDEVDGKFGRQMGMGDKVKAKAEEEIKKKGPELAHKGLSTAQGVFKKVIDGAIEGGCKKAGPAKDELAPNLGARIDNMDGCVPGMARAEGRKAPEGFTVYGAPKEGEEAPEDPILEEAKAELEADKAREGDLRSADSKDRKGDAEGYLKGLYGAMGEVGADADVNKTVVCNVEGFQYPGAIRSVDGDNVTCDMCGNNFQDPGSVTIPKEADGSKVSGTSAEDAKIPAFTALGEGGKTDFLERGRWVSVKEENSFNQAWVKKVDGSKVLVEDQFKVVKEVDAANVYTHVTQQHLATRGVALMPNYASMRFWWVASADAEGAAPVSRKVRVWRFGSEDAQEFELQAKTAKAKPTKENENPTHDVHVGFYADVEILLGAKYAYNFQIGEEYKIDFETTAASAKGCKVFTANSRVEY